MHSLVKPLKPLEKSREDKFERQMLITFTGPNNTVYGVAEKQQLSGTKGLLWVKLIHVIRLRSTNIGPPDQYINQKWYLRKQILPTLWLGIL